MPQTRIVRRIEWTIQNMTIPAGLGRRPCPPAGDIPSSIHGLVYGFNVDQLPRRKDAPGAMVGCYLNQYAFVKAILTSLFAR